MATLASRTDSSLYQPDSERLQLGIDLFIAKLEKERRLGAVLDQTISQKEQELRERKDRGRNSAYPHLLHRIDTLEKKQQLLESNIGELQSYNRLVRSRINNLRREHQSYHNVISQLTSEVDKKSKQADETHQNLRQASRLDNLQREKINILRSKSVNERSLYAQRIQEISEVIHKDAESKSNYLRDIESSIQTALTKPVEHIDVYPVQRVLLDKWTRKLTLKFQELNAYVRKIQEFESAVSQIRLATGMNGIKEITTAVIKSQEQKYELYTNVDALTGEIDTLEEGLRRSSAMIRALECSGGTSEAAATALLTDLTQRKRTISVWIQSKSEGLVSVHGALNDAMTPVSAFLEVVTAAASAIGMIRRLSAYKLTDENILGQLSATEECLDRVVEMTKGGSSQFSLEQLTPKRFHTMKLAVKAASIDHTSEEDTVLPMSEQMIRRRVRRNFESLSLPLPPPH